MPRGQVSLSPVPGTTGVRLAGLRRGVQPEDRRPGPPPRHPAALVPPAAQGADPPPEALGRRASTQGGAEAGAGGRFPALDPLPPIEEVFYSTKMPKFVALSRWFRVSPPP